MPAHPLQLRNLYKSNILVFVCLLAAASGVGAVQADTPAWDDQFGCKATGVPGLDRVLDIVVYNGTPHALGREIWNEYFEAIFEWDGTSWVPHYLPDGWGSMREMCVMGGEIYMGANCGGGNCVQVGKWNGSNFSVIGLANTGVHAIATDGSLNSKFNRVFPPLMTAFQPGQTSIAHT